MFLFSSFPQFLGNKQRTINCQNPKHSREKNKKIKKSDKEKLYPISNFTEQNQTQIPLHTTAETKNKAHVPSTRNDNKKIHSKQYNTLEFENLPPFSFLGNQTQKLDIFEHRERERERERTTSSEGLDHASSAALEIPKDLLHCTRVVLCSSSIHWLSLSLSLSQCL